MIFIRQYLIIPFFVVRELKACKTLKIAEPDIQVERSMVSASPKHCNSPAATFLNLSAAFDNSVMKRCWWGGAIFTNFINTSVAWEYASSEKLQLNKAQKLAIQKITEHGKVIKTHSRSINIESVKQQSESQKWIFFISHSI